MSAGPVAELDRAMAAARGRPDWPAIAEADTALRAARGWMTPYEERRVLRELGRLAGAARARA